MKRRLRQLLGVVVAFSTAISFAAPPTIGVASALGTFTVNDAVVQGNANLFDGSQIKTGKASSRVFMKDGVSLILGIDSIATIYSDHVVLQQGATRVDKMAGFSIRAGDYRVVSAQPVSQAVVRLTGGTVEIAALTGSLNVLNSRGVLLTKIGAGTAAAFEMGDSGGARTASVHGPRHNNNNLTRRDAALFLMILAVAAALGLFIDSIAQASPTSP